MAETADSDQIRRENATRIADVMASESGHTYRNRVGDGQIKAGESDKIRKLTYDTLMDPKTQVIKIKEPDGKISYKFYNPDRNWIVIIDQDAKDWGTAYHPDNKDRARALMREPGTQILENGKVGFLERLKLGFFSNQSRHEQVERRHTPNTPHGEGRVGRIVGAIGIAIVAIGANNEAQAQTSTGAALAAAGREIAAALIPFTGAALAAADGKVGEAVASFIGDCSWIGMGASEALRPMLRAMGANVEPGAIESALANRQNGTEDPRKRAMMDMVKDIPPMSAKDLELNKVPFSPVYQVAAKKYEIQQELDKINKLVNGRKLEDLSPEEADKYARSVGKIQSGCREINRVWSREVENKLGPSQNYGGRDPVQILKDQIAENLSRGQVRIKSIAGSFSSSEYVQDGKITPIDLAGEFAAKGSVITPVTLTNPNMQIETVIAPVTTRPPAKSALEAASPA